MRASTLLLIFAIIAWGTLLGGMVYSHLVFFSVYLSDLPKSNVLVTGPFALHDENFWLMIHPTLIILLLIALIANWRIVKRRKLILMSIILYAIIIAITSIYFVPELQKFRMSASSNIPAPEWLARGRKWMIFSIIRGTFMFFGIVPLLVALTKHVKGKQVVESSP